MEVAKITGTFGIVSSGALAIYAIIAKCVAAGTLTLKAAVAIAGATCVGGLLLATLFGVGAALILKKYKMGKKAFVAW